MSVMSFHGSQTVSVSSRRGQYISCRVLMLDDTEHAFDVPSKSTGRVLFESIVQKLQLLECDYFGLTYKDAESIPSWLDYEKAIVKQVNASSNINFSFQVKFFPPDPELLEEEYTRYLFALQIKKDLAEGILTCQEHTAVLLASFVVQSEVGNYCEELMEQDYLASMKLLPNQNRNLELKIMSHHKEHIGLTPMEADYSLLETVRKVEMYGIRHFPAKDHDGINLNLAVSYAGILVFQNNTRINLFSWAKIRKLCFKRKKFILKLHPDGSFHGKGTVEFNLTSRNWAKNFWKQCVEHHSFFRLQSARRQQLQRKPSKARFVSRGSSFRYTGRTQKELVEQVRDNYVAPRPFERSTSMRTISMLSSRASTPRYGTLNSQRDLQQSNASLATSGSRTLDRPRPSTLERGTARSRQLAAAADLDRLAFDRSGFNRLPYATESFDRMAGSGIDSNGPRGPGDNFDRSTSFQTFQSRQNVVHGNGVAESAVTGMNNNVANHGYLQMNVGRGNTLPSRAGGSGRIDPSQFMLPQSSLSRDYVYPNPSAGQVGTVVGVSQPVQNNGGSLRYAASPELSGIPVGRVTRQDHVDLTAGEDLPLPPPPMSLITGGSLSRSKIRENPISPLGNLRSLSSAGLQQTPMSVSGGPLPSPSVESPDSVTIQNFVADDVYHIVKELLMTEHTYKKDLEIVAVWFQDAISPVVTVPHYSTELLFRAFVPIYEFHCRLLTEMEQRVSSWDASLGSQSSQERMIGDLMLRHMNVLQLYRLYLEQHDEIVTQIDLALRRQADFKRVVDEFETQRICYLPLTAFLLKPVQRLLHYQLIFTRLLSCYSADHPDCQDTKACLALINGVVLPYRDNLRDIANRLKIMELQSGIIGVDSLVQKKRMYVREGCLQKLSRKGLQQRMFFLFSDVLLYASRTQSAATQFKVHGQMPVASILVKEAEAEVPAGSFSFTVSTENRTLVLVANSQEEKDKWMEDLRTTSMAARDAADKEAAKILYPSLKSNSSTENIDEASHETGDRQNQPQYRANTTMHVCWHRMTSVGSRDHYVSLQNQLSGFLLRKFKNANGWQKLWVVYTQFCLYFYKGFQDDVPLASLPLLGYAIGSPNESDEVHRDLVFKLQFRNHVYFFRAESRHAFERWLEVIHSATSSARITRMFSRLDSAAPSPVATVTPLLQTRGSSSDQF